MPYPLKEREVSLDPTKARLHQQHIGKLFQQASQQETNLDDFADNPEIKQMQLLNDKSKKQRHLFKNCHFWLSRETPVYFLQYLILSFGGTFSLSDENEEMQGVTHVCMDRPVPTTSL